MTDFNFGDDSSRIGEIRKQAEIGKQQAAERRRQAELRIQEELDEEAEALLSTRPKRTPIDPDMLMIFKFLFGVFSFLSVLSFLLATFAFFFNQTAVITLIESGIACSAVAALFRITTAMIKIERHFTGGDH